MSQTLEMARESAGVRDAEQRMRIVETAEKLFRDFGLHKTTVADIARTLRMSPANVYRFFASKAEIQEAVAAHVLGELESAARTLAAGTDSAESRLRALVKGAQAMHADRLTRDSKLHEMVEVALSDRWPIIREHLGRMRAIYAQVIADGVARGEFAPVDAHLAAGLAQAAVVSFIHPRLMVECADLPMPSVDEMLDFVVKALKADA